MAKKARTGPAPTPLGPCAKKTRTGPAPTPLGPCAAVADEPFSMQLESEGRYNKASADDLKALVQQVQLGVRLTTRVVAQSGVVVEVVLQQVKFRPRPKDAIVDGIRFSVLADGDCIEARDCAGDRPDEMLVTFSGIHRTTHCLAVAGFCRHCDGAKTYDRICCIDRCAACTWDKIAKGTGRPSFNDVSPLMSWLRRSGGRLEYRSAIPGEGRLWQVIFAIELCLGSGRIVPKIRVSLETLRPDRVIMELFVGSDFSKWESVTDGIVEVRRSLRCGFCSCAPPAPETICCIIGAQFCHSCALRQIFARE